jgi:hypothetical protein
VTPPVCGPAADSPAKAVEVAGKLGSQRRQPGDLSKDAFITMRRILAGWRIAGQPMPSTAPAELRALPQQKDCCTFQAKPPR